MGEIELAYRYSGKDNRNNGNKRKDYDHILGREILKSYYNQVFVVGNIGIHIPRLLYKPQMNH